MKNSKPSGKHYSHLQIKGLNKKKIVGFIVIVVLVLAFLFIFITQNSGNDKSDNNETNEIFTTVNEIADTNTIENEVVEKNIVDVEMPDSIEYYNILGQIVIEKAGIDRYVLDRTNDYSLNLSVTKFYGADLNEVGNCCITGHNMEGHFKELKHLKEGDTFYIIDKKNKEKVTYEIYDMYTSLPTNLECLDQDTNNQREVTLITCNPRRTY